MDKGKLEEFKAAVLKAAEEAYRAYVNRLEELFKTLEVAEEKPSRLEQLPWRSYRSGRGEWIFVNAKGAEWLVERLKATPDKTVVMGGYRYRLQGDDRFIARYPKRG